jgi:D-3-phosphoglycerate dehydrogenase
VFGLCTILSGTREQGDGSVQIVVLDDVLLYDEHLEILNKLGTLKIFSGTPADNEEIIKRGTCADIIISGWTHYPAEVFDGLKNLKLISLWSTGTDYVDLTAAQMAGVKVLNVPGYARNAVAELTFGLILAVARKILAADRDFRDSGINHWDKFEGVELAGKTIGVLGTGAIGKKVARIAHGFEMKVVAYDPFPNMDLVAEGILEYVSFENAISKSDVLTVHMPLIPETIGIIDKTILKSMQNHCIFINTARAGLVDQCALTELLMNGSISGAGLDDIELSLPSAEKLFTMKQVVLTPHIGFNTQEATKVKTDLCVNNVVDFLNSKLHG